MFKRFKLWKFPKDRTEMFSDAVFAIVITLLVLEIKVPHIENHSSSAELFHALREMLPKIISWVASFFFVIVMWVQHHQLFRLAAKIDYGMVWLNNVLLMFICFLPFPAALMGEYPNNQLGVLMFGAVSTLATLTQIWLYGYMIKNYLLPQYDKAAALKNVKRSLMLAPMLLLSATILSFISLLLPYFIYLLVPFLFLLPLDKDPA